MARNGARYRDKAIIYCMLFKRIITDKSGKKDIILAEGCVLYYLMSVLNATIKTVLPEFGVVSVLSLLAGSVILLGFLRCLPTVFTRNRRKLLLSYAFFISIYSISFLLITIRGESSDVMIRGSAFLTLAWWIPLGVFASSVYDKSILYEVFLKASYFILGLLAVMFIYHPISEDGVADYNMFFGFNMLLPTLFHINELFKRKKFYFFLLVFIEFMMILIYANRGCLLPIAFIVVYKLIFENSKKTTILLPIIIVMAGVIGLMWEQIIGGLASLLEGFGFSSRTLWYITFGELTDSSGRDDIWKHSIEMIKEHPILGWGLGGEFYHLAALDGTTIVDNSATPHNGVLQNLVNFGVFFGTIATIFIIRPYFKLRCIKDNYYHDLVLIFGSAIIAIFYSASGFFTNPMVALFLYLAYSYKKSGPRKA